MSLKNGFDNGSDVKFLFRSAYSRYVYAPPGSRPEFEVVPLDNNSLASALKTTLEIRKYLYDSYCLDIIIERLADELLVDREGL